MCVGERINSGDKNDHGAKAAEFEGRPDVAKRPSPRNPPGGAPAFHGEPGRGSTRKRFITAGRLAGVALRLLIKDLELAGFLHHQASSAEDLAPLLENFAGAPVVVYSPAADPLARPAMKAIGPRCHRTSVIVVTDRANFDEHYELLCQGAYDYFELSEGFDVIEEAVKWAAGRPTGALWAGVSRPALKTRVAPATKFAPSRKPTAADREALKLSA